MEPEALARGLRGKSPHRGGRPGHGSGSCAAFRVLSKLDGGAAIPFGTETHIRVAESGTLPGLVLKSHRYARHIQRSRGRKPWLMC
jgi:hypothetical protein